MTVVVQFPETPHPQTLKGVPQSGDGGLWPPLASMSTPLSLDPQLKGYALLRGLGEESCLKSRGGRGCRGHTGWWLFRNKAGFLETTTDAKGKRGPSNHHHLHPCLHLLRRVLDLSAGEA
jgi:hypothetical protein